VRSALLTVLKSASASTLDIINRVKAALPRIKATLPPELEITQLFDQSIFVRAAINGVLKEGVIAACLTALMILLFLGSWRSTVVVATSIPLSILCSIIILSALGQTMNLMTLGGLALAVGILVDDATVEIENIHRNLAMKKPMVRFLLSEHLDEIDTSLAHGFGEHDGSEEKIEGRHREDRSERQRGATAQIFGFLGKIHDRFNHEFEKVRNRYVNALRWCLEH